MPAFTLFFRSGLLRDIKTDIGISVATQIKEKYDVGDKIIKKVAVWDTGATASVISDNVAEELSLKPIDQQIISTVGHPPHTANVYLVDLYLPNRVRVSDIRVIGAKELGDCDCLIGMDIIAHGDFCITCVDQNKTCISFRLPSLGKKVDFVEEDDKALTRMRSKPNASSGYSKRKRSRRPK